MVANWVLQDIARGFLGGRWVLQDIAGVFLGGSGCYKILQGGF